MRTRDDIDLAQRRVLFALLRPASMVAASLDFPLHDLVSYVRLGYFRELRQRGVTLTDAAASMEVSARTAKRLAAQLRSDFFRPESEHDLARRIEFMTWAQPLSVGRLRQLLKVSDEELDDALRKLRDEARVVRTVDERGTYYQAAQLVSRLVSDVFSDRIGALNSLLRNVTEVVERRFLDEPGDAFARTLNFRMNRADLGELNAAYNALLQTMLDLEARVEEDDAVPMRLSLVWSEISQDDAAATFADAVDTK